MRALVLAAVVAGCAAPGTFGNAPPALDDPQTIEDGLALLETLAGVRLGEDMSAGDREKIGKVCAGLRLRALAGLDQGTVPWRVWCEALGA